MIAPDLEIGRGVTALRGACQLVGAFTTWQATVRAPISWLSAIAFDVFGQTQGVMVKLATVAAADIRANYTGNSFHGVIGHFPAQGYDRVMVTARRVDGSTAALAGKAEIQVRGWCESAAEIDEAGVGVTPAAALWTGRAGPAAIGVNVLRSNATPGERDNITSISLTTDDDTARALTLVRVLGGTSEIVASFLMGGAGPDQHAITFPSPLRGFRATTTDAARWELLLLNFSNTGHFINVAGYTD